MRAWSLPRRFQLVGMFRESRSLPWRAESGQYSEQIRRFQKFIGPFRSHRFSSPARVTYCVAPPRRRFPTCSTSLITRRVFPPHSLPICSAVYPRRSSSAVMFTDSRAQL